MNVRTRIDINEGTFVISCEAAETTAGTENPSIFNAEIANSPIIVDGEYAREGELVLSQHQYDESELIQDTGHLVVKPFNDDANNYSLDGVELVYNDANNDIQQVIVYPGNSFILNLNPRLNGTIAFTDIDYNITGTLEIDYRFTIDGLFWDEWRPISEMISSGDQLSVENNIEIQIRIRNIGSSNSVFSYFNIEGNIDLDTFIAPILNASVFGDLLGTDGQIKLENNLFKKLYFQGILPKYITRGENRSYKEDEDFVLFFKSVARYYSLIIRFFKRWENWYNDFDMLREQLIGYGIYFNENSSSLQDLQILCQNLYSVAQQRGTRMIYRRKEEAELERNSEVIDGEFLRLTRNRICDELVYDYIPKWNVGWCMRQGSPLYAGTCQSHELNKTLEKSKNFQSLNNVNHAVTAGGTVSLQTIDEKQVVNLHVAANGDIAAIGRLNQVVEITDEDIVYTADPQIDYEITFAVRFDSNTAHKTFLQFGVEGFDVNKMKLNDAFMNPNGTVVNERFFSIDTSKFVANEWYFVRGIIHAYSTVNKEKILTNTGFGTDLYFCNPFVKYIMPNITLISGDPRSVDAYIWDYKIRPLVRGRNILPLKSGKRNFCSLGFLQFGRFYYTYFHNRNNTKSVDEVTSIIEKYLYNFDAINLFTITGNKN